MRETANESGAAVLPGCRDLVDLLEIGICDGLVEKQDVLVCDSGGLDGVEILEVEIRIVPEDSLLLKQPRQQGEG